ncbi:MAG: methionyl-tRNA formyltransferase [Betaproteobacteria bacterium]|nr:methionyl-tRNA formyltransferase [Betaproteobacteria bacterium]
MKVAFAGTPEFAATALRALLSAGFQVPLVLTQPDRPAGRGLKLQASPVKQVALNHGLAVAQPRGLRLDGRWADDAAAARAALEAAGADVMVVAAYGLILPAWVLNMPPKGCLNIHASLLPRWRGAAPIHRAVQAGDERSGVTIMQMDEGLDTGPVLLMEPLDLSPRETTATLHDKLSALGARLMVQALERAACGGLVPQPQPTEGVSYAHKIDKAEAPLDWQQPAPNLERRVRAFDPFPGATCRFGDELVKVWKAQALPQPPLGTPGAGLAAAGTVLSVQAHGVEVACGQGRLLLEELQRPGGRRQPAAAVAQSLRWAPGMTLH